jgi:hypothetical protein
MAELVTAAWLDELPDEMRGHVAALRRLVTVVDSDPRFRALQVQGSVGRGTGDRFSDLDVGLVVANTEWPVIVDDLPDIIHSLAQVVDQQYEFLPSIEAPEVLRAWAQFDSGVQLDMIVLPAFRTLGSGPDGRTLVDRDDLLPRTDHPQRLSAPEDVAKWSFLCWHNLDEAAKSIERGRYPGAVEWIGSARLATISCWGALNGLEFSAYANVVAGQLGLRCPWPDGLELTYPAPDRAALITAAEALTRLQSTIDEQLSEQMGLALRPIAPWVSRRVSRLADGRQSPRNRQGARTDRETGPAAPRQRPARKGAPRGRARPTSS